MRAWTLLPILTLFLFDAALAAPTEYLFRGPYKITQKNAGCVSVDPVGETGVMRFQVRVDGQASSFSLFGDGFDQSFRRAGLFTTRFQPVETMTIGARFAPLANPVSVKFIIQAPKPITANTKFVDLTVTIKGWSSIANCNVTFRAALIKNQD